MAQVIIESGIEAASNTDVLAGGRLTTVPDNGLLTFEFLNQLADATNSGTISINLPNGDVPVQAQLLPGANPALAGVIDDRQKFMASFPIQQGGKCLLVYTETGTTVMAWRVTFTPLPK